MLLQLIHKSIHLRIVAVAEICDFRDCALQVIRFGFLLLFFVELAPFFYFRLRCCIQVRYHSHEHIQMLLQF